jgi:glycosyltransferase involved in cell wall biosynthesis
LQRLQDNLMNNSVKISYYLSHPIQYFSPLLRQMAEVFELQVYYFSDASIKGNMDKGFNQAVKWDIPLLQGYKYRFLKNISGRKSLSNRMWDAINPGVIKSLINDPSKIVIVNGWSYFSTLLTIFTGKILGKKIWLRAENPLNQEFGKSKKTLFVKKIILKLLLFPFINKFLYIGTESRKFFEYYGIKPERLLFTPYAVDNDYFRQQHSDLPDSDKLKSMLNLPLDKKIILFSGKYIDKKRPIDLVRAFALLNDPTTMLVMVGEGELRSEMEHLIAAKGISVVVLTGFINQSEISKYYAVADLFVMCSGAGETWGLAVNEAMNFGLPVIVSDTCGSCVDLVQNGVNGFSFEEGNIESLKSCIEKLLNDNDFRSNAGKVSLKLIEQYSINNIVSNMENFLKIPVN